MFSLLNLIEKLNIPPNLWVSSEHSDSPEEANLSQPKQPFANGVSSGDSHIANNNTQTVAKPKPTGSAPQSTLVVDGEAYFVIGYHFSIENTSYFT